MIVYLDASALVKRYVAGEPLAARAGTLAWEHGLRGYDAVHLATALFWRERSARRSPRNLRLGTVARRPRNRPFALAGRNAMNI